jgi:hypothetical protein
VVQRAYKACEEDKVQLLKALQAVKAQAEQ